MIVFKYNNKIWKPKNPEKKLKQLGITWDDVEIIKEEEKIEDNSIDTSIIKHHFINRKTGYTITTIYDYVNDDDYEQID